MRRDITFTSAGLRCRGWLYAPDGLAEGQKSPTALLLIPAEKDGLIPVAAVKETYERAQEPKALLALPITHFDIYYEPWFSQAAGAAIDWFERYL